MKKVTLKIDGMHCSHCAESVFKALKEAGCLNVNVDLAGGNAIFDTSEPTSVEQLCEAINRLGFSAAPVGE